MTLHPALARLERGFRRMWAWVRARVTGRRDHRFEGEQANLADQLAQTQTSLGLLAAAAQHRDDEHRLQALHTEQMLRDRKRVLEKHRRKRGLADEERWELESINRGLDDLTSPARPDTHGEQLLADFEPDLVRRTDGGWKPQGFAALALMGGMKLWMIFGGVAALAGLWGGVQTWRVDNLKDDLREARAERAQLERNLAQTTTERDMLADAHELAIAQSQQTSATIEAERARRLRAESEARRIRNEMARARDGVPDIDYGFGGVRDDGAATPSAGGGDTAGGRSR